MSHPRAKCATCPVKRDCFASHAGSPRLCQLAATDPRYKALVIERSDVEPGVLAMAARLATAVAKQVRAGNPQASAEVRAARKAECEKCPLFDAEAIRCRRCGCWLGRKWPMATARCPLNPPRWGPVA